MKKTVFLLGLCVLALQAQLLTLEECIEKALETHPDIRGFMLQIERSGQEIASEKAARLPQLFAHVEYDPQKTYVLPQNGTFGTRDGDSFEAGVTLSQKLWDFSKTSRRIEAARIGKETAAFSLEEAGGMMRYRVQTLYALVLLQQSALEVRRKDLEAKEALYEQAKALVAQGLKTRADESRFLAASQQAENALFASEADIEKTKIALGFLIGETIPEAARFEMELPKEGHADAGEELLFLQNNPRLRIAAKEASQAKALYRAADAEHYGSLDAVAAYTRFDTLSSYDTTLVGIRYTLPLFAGGKLNAAEQKAKIAHSIAKTRQESRRRELLQEFRQLGSDLRRMEKTIEARQAQLLSAQETKSVVEGRYGEGLSTYVEVLDAAAVWLDARLGLMEAYYIKQRTLYRLEYLKGGNHEA